MRRLILRALLLWFAMLAFALRQWNFAGAPSGPDRGAGRRRFLFGAVARPCGRALPWLLVSRAPGAFALSVWLAIGLLWAGLSAAPEFGVFHWLLRTPWQTLLADYDPRHGYFGFVQLTLLLAPVAWAAGRRSRR